MNRYWSYLMGILIFKLKKMCFMKLGSLQLKRLRYLLLSHLNLQISSIILIKMNQISSNLNLMEYSICLQAIRSMYRRSTFFRTTCSGKYSWVILAFIPWLQSVKIIISLTFDSCLTETPTKRFMVVKCQFWKLISEQRLALLLR